MKRRVYVYAGLAVLLLVWLASVLYSRAFPIQPDGGNLTEYASQHLNRGNSIPMENHIKLYDSIVIGKKKFTLMELNGDLGEIRLTRGLNGRYRIDSIGYGDGNFREELVRDDEKNYCLIGGRNTYFGIAEIAVALDGRTYRLDVPEGERFFVSAEVDAAIEETHALPEDISFYDREGKDITEQVPWN